MQQKKRYDSFVSMLKYGIGISFILLGLFVILRDCCNVYSCGGESFSSYMDAWMMGDGEFVLCGVW